MNYNEGILYEERLTKKIMSLMKTKKIRLIDMSEAIGFKSEHRLGSILYGNCTWRTWHLPVVADVLGITLDELFKDV